jgi:hypothetical protein
VALIRTRTCLTMFPKLPVLRTAVPLFLLFKSPGMALGTYIRNTLQHRTGAKQRPRQSRRPSAAKRIIRAGTPRTPAYQERFLANRTKSVMYRCCFRSRETQKGRSLKAPARLSISRGAPRSASPRWHGLGASRRARLYACAPRPCRSPGPRPRSLRTSPSLGRCNDLLPLAF